MVDPTSVAGAVGTAVQSIMQDVYYFVGGLFGLYVILVALRWWEYRMVKKLLKDIKLEMRHMNEKLCGSVPIKDKHFLLTKIKRIKEKFNHKKPKKKR